MTANAHAADYALLAAQVGFVVEGCPWVSALANASALIAEALEDVNWVGFYLMAPGPDGAPSLELGPFQGRVACVRLGLGHGVCAAAATTDSTVLVRDVHQFEGHIACDAATNAEIVVPMHAAGRVVGVLDIDSPTTGRFTQADAAGLERVVDAIERCADLSQLPPGSSHGASSQLS